MLTLSVSLFSYTSAFKFYCIIPSHLELSGAGCAMTLLTQLPKDDASQLKETWCICSFWEKVNKLIGSTDDCPCSYAGGRW